MLKTGKGGRFGAFNNAFVFWQALGKMLCTAAMK
jgi:hypothetical protein